MQTLWPNILESPLDPTHTKLPPTRVQITTDAPRDPHTTILRRRRKTVGAHTRWTVHILRVRRDKVSLTVQIETTALA